MGMRLALDADGQEVIQDVRCPVLAPSYNLSEGTMSSEFSNHGNM
jgi:hypothetical protein